MKLELRKPSVFVKIKALIHRVFLIIMLVNIGLMGFVASAFIFDR